MTIRRISQETVTISSKVPMFIWGEYRWELQKVGHPGARPISVLSFVLGIFKFQCVFIQVSLEGPVPRELVINQRAFISLDMSKI